MPNCIGVLVRQQEQEDNFPVHINKILHFLHVASKNTLYNLLKMFAT